MRGKDAAATYDQISAHGGSPVGMIVSLYDTILRDFRRAQVALDTGMVEARVFELNHALDVIGHLEGVLDYNVVARQRGVSRGSTGLPEG
jgi:flagellin-specific chaperone FliS